MKVDLTGDFQGLRDDGYEDKKNRDENGKPKWVDRYLADVYVDDLGAVEVQVDAQQVESFRKMKRGTRLKLPLKLEFRNNVKTSDASGRKYARRELEVRMLSPELLAG